MYETLHINQRVRQRGITNRMIELDARIWYCTGRQDQTWHQTYSKNFCVHINILKQIF